MTKIVYNVCFGGFSLSRAAVDRLAELGLTVPGSGRDVIRHDARLVQVVEELGPKADGGCAKLCIADIPSGCKYRIDEYDGAESVMTPEDYKWEIAP